MKNTDHIAAVQINCREGNIKHNANHIKEFILNIKNDKDNILIAVFPEMCLYGYENFENIIKNYTQSDISDCLENIMDTCILTGIDAVIGAPRITSEGVENAQYYISHKGSITHVYSKIHLISCEKGKLKPGSKFCIYNTPLGKAGFLICWDLAFPEAARIYGKSGADFIIASAAWESPYVNQWCLSLCSRSFDNSIPVIGANRAGRNSDSIFIGNSIITDAMGNIIARADNEKECYIKASLADISYIDKEFGQPVFELREDIYNTDNLTERKD